MSGLISDLRANRRSLNMKKEFAVGDRVRVVALPPYVKTAEPMPMLRPPNVIYLGEEGMAIDRRPGGYWVVRFNKGTFLLDSQYIELVEATTDAAHVLGDPPPTP